MNHDTVEGMVAKAIEASEKALGIKADAGALRADQPGLRGGRHAAITSWDLKIKLPPEKTKAVLADLAEAGQGRALLPQRPARSAAPWPRARDTRPSTPWWPVGR